jgi:hypothetical protein
MKPGGRVIVVDFRRIVGQSSDWVLSHVRAGQPVVEAEIVQAGFEKLHEEPELLKENYFIVFRKPVPAARSSQMFPELQKYIEHRVIEFVQISADRKAQLKEVAAYIKSWLKAGQPARITFICTHNSRRSHLAQIWAAIAARHFGVAGVETFSGGTEATAFNPRAIAAIERAGLKVDKLDQRENPRYSVRFQAMGEPLICFSKVYSSPPNPNDNFCAVMTCSQADESCPLVNGATLRVAIPYDDPKVADNTPEESARYDERCAQISRELFFLFSVVRD